MSYHIPVDSEGYVPEEALMKRYKDFYAVKQREYNIKREMSLARGKNMPKMDFAKKDYSNTADHTIPLKSTPQQAVYWWVDPSSMDIEDMDAPGMTPSQKRNQGKIKVVSTPIEEQKFRRTLVSTYTPDDVSKFAESRPVVAIAPCPDGYSGKYIPERTRIVLDRKHGLNQGTLAHEGAHHLRATDKSRKNPITTVNKHIGVEESCTVAEQMARSDAPDYTGYYWKVAVYDTDNHVWRKPTSGEARKMAEEDHMLFTEGRGKGLKGDAALHSVQAHWKDSHISRLRLGGNMMAINIMAEAVGNVDKLSMAKPRTTKTAADVTTAKITNATAGRPGMVTANRFEQTTPYNKCRK